LTPGFRPSRPVPSCRSRPVRAGGAGRRWRAVRFALAAAPALLLIAAAPSAAQTSVTLVSNGEQTSGARSLGLGDLSTAFTTGSSAEGYNLTSVDFWFAATAVTGISTDLYDTNSDGSPNNEVGDLIAPATISGGRNTFTTSGTGISLSPNTTYAVFIDTGVTTTGFISTTSSNDEDSGAAPGWSIADGGLTRADDTSAWTSTDALQFTVTGYAKDTTAPTLDSAVVNGDKLKLNYNEALDTDSTPAATDFTVSVAGTDQTPSGVSASGSAVTLFLGTRAVHGQSVTVTYTKGTNPIQDLAGNDGAPG